MQRRAGGAGPQDAENHRIFSLLLARSGGELEIGWTFLERALGSSLQIELDALLPATLDRAFKGEL